MIEPRNASLSARAPCAAMCLCVVASLHFLFTLCVACRTACFSPPCVHARARCDFGVCVCAQGFEVEYWSPAPGWKNSQAYIDGTLSGYDAATLAEFGNAVVEDAQYLESNGLPVSWWGLQNEPAVGPEGCIYSCCGYVWHVFIQYLTLLCMCRDNCGGRHCDLAGACRCVVC